MPPRRTSGRGKKGKAVETEATPTMDGAVGERVEAGPSTSATGVEEAVVEDDPAATDPETEVASTSTTRKLTMEERMAKLKELRQKMADSSRLNRKAVASESQQRRQAGTRIKPGTARKVERAERILDQRDATERGEDFERLQSWNYTIEDNERWEVRLAEKERRKDQGYLDAQSASERAYRRLVAEIKPEQQGSAAQKGKNRASASSSDALVPASVKTGLANDLRYGTHRPDDAALDRVAAHLNAEEDLRSKRSRYRADDPDADVDYINDKNKHYNKKIKRFFDPYVGEIRDSFERGTAL